MLKFIELNKTNMKLLRTIFYFPFIFYITIITLITIIKYLKAGFMRDEKGKIVFSEDWFMHVGIPIFESKLYLREHLAWIFWIVIASIITYFNI
jgi:hypothetical protein